MKTSILVKGFIVIALISLVTIISLAIIKTEEFNNNCESKGGVSFHSRNGAICIKKSAVIQ